MSLDYSILEFIKPFHITHDPMTDETHIHRLRFMVSKLGKKLEIPYENINYALYFHDLNDDEAKELSNYMLSHGFDTDHVEYLRNLEKYTNNESKPQTDEEKLIHDAHILEGGPYFTIIKAIVSGYFNLYTLEESINIFELQELRARTCYFPETTELLEQQISKAKKMLSSLRENLPLSFK